MSPEAGFFPGTFQCPGKTVPAARRVAPGRTSIKVLCAAAGRVAVVCGGRRRVCSFCCLCVSCGQAPSVLGIFAERGVPFQPCRRPRVEPGPPLRCGRFCVAARSAKTREMLVQLFPEFELGGRLLVGISVLHAMSGCDALRCFVTGCLPDILGLTDPGIHHDTHSWCRHCQAERV